MKPEKIDHICIAVKDLKEAVAQYTKAFQLDQVDAYVDENEKINVVRFMVGEVGFELMESTSEDGEVAKFIKKNGEGVFLISFKVPDVPEAMQELADKGVKVIDETPRKWRSSNFTFLNPGDYNGVLVELID
jgi:methylmalonyl-CoA/ethylmalonyl-CoA epimerase